jgi:hypothetical protein
VIKFREQQYVLGFIICTFAIMGSVVWVFKDFCNPYELSYRTRKIDTITQVFYNTDNRYTVFWEEGDEIKHGGFLVGTVKVDAENHPWLEQEEAYHTSGASIRDNKPAILRVMRGFCFQSGK